MRKIAIVHRSYENVPSCSHAGLGICAINTSKTLNQHNIHSEVWPVPTSDAIFKRLETRPDITHVVIQAPWVPIRDLAKLSSSFVDVQFAVNCHSNVGFLQTEPQAITLMIDILDLEQTTNNVHASGNSQEFCDWIEGSYQSHCTLLPNLYYVNNQAYMPRPLWNGGTLRIGLFGATRPQKNIMTGAAGAIQIAQMLKTHTEIWVNTGRLEGSGKTILEAVRRAIARNPFCVLKEFHWAAWPEFRRHISSMNLLIQASYTESFNQVTADGIVTGVPTVVSPAIRWAPDYWKCDVDSADSISQIGRMLIGNPLAHKDGLDCLIDHNNLGLLAWKKYLKGKPFKKEGIE